MDGVAIAATFGGIATIIGLFMKYISSRDKSQEKRDEMFVKALSESTKATIDMMESQKKDSRIALKQNKKIGDQAEQRNGHLAEVSVSGNLKILAAIAKLPSIEIANQSVDTQTVKNQTIKELI